VANGLGLLGVTGHVVVVLVLAYVIRRRTSRMGMGFWDGSMRYVAIQRHGLGLAVV
jgi:hypothetical protein